MWASYSPATGCACAFLCQMLVAPQPVGVCVLTTWPIVAFSSIPALMRHFLARQLPFSIISNCHAEARSWKRAPRWWISPKKNAHQNFREEYDTEQFLCIVQSTQSAKHVKCSACFFSSWRNVRRRTTRRLEVSHQQRKSDMKYAEDFPLIFTGCDVIWAEMLFTNFFVVHNISLSAASHDLCSGAHFHKSKLRRRIIYVRYTQNLITTLKIRFCYAKVVKGWQLWANNYHNILIKS